MFIVTGYAALRVRTPKNIFLFSTKTCVVGAQKHPKHMLKLMGKINFTILR